jgi:uncharacterized membrane-anchored protein
MLMAVKVTDLETAHTLYQQEMNDGETEAEAALTVIAAAAPMLNAEDFQKIARFVLGLSDDSGFGGN